jgi:surface polysaccharide O-acyltransferase-like enzyme
MKPRISSIETFRVFAAFAVICLHVFPFRFMQGGATVFYIINNSGRFAVPFFLLASGYSFGKCLQRGIPVYTLLIRYVKMLFVLYIAWFLIYGLLAGSMLKSIPELGFWKGYLYPIFLQPAVMLQRFRSAPLEFLLFGPAEHLWFLSAQIAAFIILALFIKGQMQKYLVPLSILMYLVSLLGSAYGDSTFCIPLGRYYGPIGAFTFVVIGWWLSHRSPPSLTLAAVICAGGYILQLAEAFLLWKILAIKPLFCYLFGTFPFSIGVFLLALAISDTAKTSVLRKIGGLTAGIYLIHLLIVREIRFLGFTICPFIWEIACPFAVFFLSAALVLLLRRSRYTRFLV